jgi:hypothetical protein
VGMMDSMMKGMIRALPVEEREALLLKMMPDMMKQADMAKLMPNMMKEMAGLLSLWSLYEFMRTLLADDEAKELVGGALGAMHEKMPVMMEMMHPMMVGMMSDFMPKMMGFMAKAMPNMKDIMPEVMHEAMMPKMEEDPALKEHMLGMMQTMFPHCAENMFPLIEKEERTEFIERLQGIMEKSAAVETDHIH